jgi:hypothetical protein
VKGNGYRSFFVAVFNFLKSIQIFSLPFFLGTTTMGDNHVASSTYLINLTTNNLSISCFDYCNIVCIQHVLIRCDGGIIVSNSILCCANSSGILFSSLNVHAKTSLNSFNIWPTSNTLHVFNCALIFTICGYALIPKLSFINCWFLVNVHPAIYNSCDLIFVGVSSIAILPSWYM